MSIFNIDELCRLRSDLKTGDVVGSTLRYQDQIDRYIKALDDVIGADSGNEYFPGRRAYFNGVKDGRATALPQGEWVMFKDVQSVIKPILKRFYGAADSDIEYIMQEIEQKAYLKGGEEG